MRSKGLERAALIILILLSLLCVVPLILVVTSSFTSEKALYLYGYSLFPSEISLDAYRYLLTSKDQLLRAYLLSFVVTFAGTACSILITTLLAYPLSKPELPGRGFFSFFIFFTMLFNGGLMILVRTYLTTNIPREILDAGEIDGASQSCIFFRIVIPMSLPILATVGFMSGLAYWNDWQNGLYYLVRRTDLFTIQNLLNRIQSSADALKNSTADELFKQGMNIPSVGARMAISVFAMLPMLLVYPFFQKGFIKGIVIGGVKG